MALVQEGELREEVGYVTTADAVRHVWHQKVVSPTYSQDWDGAIHDYFLVRCGAWTADGVVTSEQLVANEGITEFRWWRLSDMDALTGPEVFRPRRLPALLRELLSDPVGPQPIRI